MCPIGRGEVKRKAGVMEDWLFELLFQEVKEMGSAVRFVRWGEPTMHPNCYDYIKRFTDAKIPVHMNTNGSLLSVEKVMASGLDSLKFSLQGTDPVSYRIWRKEDFYEGLRKKALELFGKCNGKPYITVGSTAIDCSANQEKEFIRDFHDRADEVFMGRTLDLSQPAEKYLECPEVFDKLSVNWDGTVVACCGDYDNKMVVGEFPNKPLAELFHCEKMQEYRKLLANFKHKKLPLCRNCVR